ncbi:MAG: hypothetical protein ABI778_08795, partial [Ignavibacteriota bacterium]
PNKLAVISTITCAVLFCTSSAFGQEMDTCKRWLGWIGIRPSNAAEYKMQYDTLHRYIMSCAKNDDSYRAFNGLDGAVYGYAPDDTTRYDQYRSWLLSVLYLNTTQPYYFCGCMKSISSTYRYGKYYPLGYLAVLNYLRNDSFCWSDGNEKAFIEDSTYYARHGYDPSHLPSLDSLGLGFLIKSNVKSPVSHFAQSYLASFTSNRNSFRKETTLDFTLNRMSYVTLAVFDELGRLVWGDGKGSSLEAGTHSIHLDGNSLPSGTLYARISTGFGEVRTVKLAHEK